MFKKILSISVSKLVIYSIIIIQCCVVAGLAINHSPFFDFDESNTINISKQSVPEIFEVLSYEQNFPAYYVLLHALFSLGADFELVIFGQYCLWILSIYLFWKLLPKTGADKLTQDWVTLLYCLCSAIWKYTFYVRMYMLSIVVTELLLLTIFVMPQKSKFRIYLMLLLSVVLCLLHPGGIIFTGVLAGSLLFFKHHRVEALGILLFSAVTTWFNFFLKPDVFQTFAVGTEYIKGQAQTAIPFISRLFFEIDTVFLAYPLVVLLLISSFLYVSKIKSTQWFKIPVHFYLVTSMIAILFIAISVDTDIISIKTRHILSFVVTVLLFLASIISTFRLRVRIVVLSLFTVIICLQSMFSRSRLVAFENNQTDFCKTAQSLDVKTVVTSYHTINGLIHCLEHQPQKMLLVSRIGVDNITHSSKQELLIVQAKNGGVITPGYIKQYEEYMDRSPEALKHVSEEMSEELIGSETFAYAVTLESLPTLLKAEEQIFAGYTVKQFLPPAFYIFDSDNFDKKE